MNGFVPADWPCNSRRRSGAGLIVIPVGSQIRLVFNALLARVLAFTGQEGPLPGSPVWRIAGPWRFSETVPLNQGESAHSVLQCPSQRGGVGVAVSIPACQAGGRGFKSRRLRQVKRGDRNRSPLCFCGHLTLARSRISPERSGVNSSSQDGGRRVAGRPPVTAGRQGAPRTHLGTVGYGRALELRDLKEPEQETRVANA